MNKAKLASALGFAMKAGKVRSGELAAEKALRSGKAMVAVLDETASELTKKHWSDMCKNTETPLVFAEGVGRAIGRDAHMVACITDNGFAGMILRSANENES